MLHVQNLSPSAAPWLALSLFLFAAPTGPLVAAEIVFADGRRAEVVEPRQDSKGNWTAVRDGRRTPLVPGDVVVLIDDEGVETLLIPALSEDPMTPDEEAALATLRDAKDESWPVAAEAFGRRPTRGLHEALTALVNHRDARLRERAIAALARTKTPEGVMAAAAAVVAEKDTKHRRAAASSLFAVKEIFRRCDAVDSVDQGLDDRDAVVRVTFALLAPVDHVKAGDVLRADGLKSSDHHVRESAALALGLRGDGGGEPVLLGMLERTRLPGVDDEALMKRLLAEEQVEVCKALGRIGTEKAKQALKKASATGPEAVRKAAFAALERAEAKSG